MNFHKLGPLGRAITKSASGPSWSSSRDVCLFLCWFSPFHVIFLRGRTGAERAWSVDWCDLDLDLDLE